jgi:hypothetical protein
MGGERTELKCLVHPDDTDKVLQALGLMGPGEAREIHFFDSPDLALLSRGLIVRTRRAADGGAGSDLTLKVRGDAPAAAASAQYAAALGETTKLEGDKVVGKPAVASFSVTRDVDAAAIDATIAALTALFSLGALFAPPVALRAFGPIASTAWKVKDTWGLHSVAVEQWTIGAHRLVELSTHPKDDAECAAHETALAAGLAQAGLRAYDQPKTTYALGLLRAP